MFAMKQLTDNFEDNTQSSDLTDSLMHRKRRADSPWLWVQLVGGSLVFHGALLAIALPLTARLSAAAQGSSSTPVEFVELSEPASEPEGSLPIESAVPPEPVAAVAQPAPEQSAPEQPAPALNEPIFPGSIGFAPEPSPEVLPPPVLSPEVFPSPELSPEPSPEVQTETPFETAVAPPQPDSLPLPVLPSPSSPSSIQPTPEPPQPEQPLPEAAPETPIPEAPIPEAPIPEAPTQAPETSVPEAPANTNSDRSELPASDRSPPEFPSTDTTAAALPPEPNPPDPQPEISPSDPGLQTTTIDTPIPDVSESIAADPSTVDSDSDNLNSANSEAEVPVGVTLSLSSSSRVAPGANAPDETLEIARPLNSSTSFLPNPSVSACQITPDVLNRTGTPIALKMTTDEQGGVMNVEVYQSSGSLDYDQLAVCLVKEWNFAPATVLNASETQRQAIASDELLITITIDRSP